MRNRRNFLQATVCGMLAPVMASFPELSFANNVNNAAVVKQPEECETFFVRENTPITFHIAKTTDNISSVSLLTEELIAGSVIPVHKHLDADEFFFFLSGSGEITVDDKTFAFKQGTAGFVPRNTWHTIKNTSNDKVMFCFGYSPAGFENFFREVGTPKDQQFKAKQKDEFDSICKKYGMVFK